MVFNALLSSQSCLSEAADQHRVHDQPGYTSPAGRVDLFWRAIATRNGGSQLVWSPEFIGQLPSSAGLYPSAFAWLNPKGALGVLAGLTPSPALREIAAGRDPILVMFDGTPEQIHASSRTRVSGLIMDVMLLQSLSGATMGQR